MSTYVERENGTRADVEEAIEREGNTDIPGTDGTVILKGTFNFGAESVKVSPGRPLTITASADDIVKGIKPIINGGGGKDGTGALYGAFVINTGQSVTIQNLHFEGASAFAIQVAAVNGLLIENCSIHNVMPLPTANPKLITAGGIVVTEKASGDVVIQNNQIDVGGSDKDRTFGIQVNQKGAVAFSSVRISANTVKNTTAHGVALRDINGSASIEDNTIITGSVGSKPPDIGDSFVDGIFCQGSGAYMVQNNRMIDCGFENAAGIRLSSSVKGAVVDGNTINMSMKYSPITGAPKGAPGNYFPYAENAAIELRKDCSDNQVSTNTISGFGRAALVLVSEPAATNFNNNQFRKNVHVDYRSAIADILVGVGVNRTTITGGPGTILDDGSLTSAPNYGPPPREKPDPHEV